MSLSKPAHAITDENYWKHTSHNIRKCTKKKNTPSTATAHQCNGKQDNNCNENWSMYLQCPNDHQDCDNTHFTGEDSMDFAVRLFPGKGLGLLSMVEIRELQQNIGEYTGEIINEKMLNERYKDSPPDSPFYYMKTADDEFIDATAHGNRTRFINHSCNPNCMYERWTDKNGEPKIRITNTRQIAAEEEITINYFQTGAPRKTLPCRCNANNCSGTMGKPTTTHPKKAKKTKNSQQRLPSLTDILTNEAPPIWQHHNINMNLQENRCWIPSDNDSARLNDTAVHKWLSNWARRRNIHYDQQKPNPDLHPDTWILSSYFYTTLKNANGDFNVLNRWLKKIDLDKITHIFIPIHHPHDHWTLIYLNTDTHTITHYDSISSRRKDITQLILNWWEHAIRINKGRKTRTQNWKQSTPRSPQQTNNVDCGIFMLFFLAALSAPHPSLPNPEIFTIPRIRAWMIRIQNTPRPYDNNQIDTHILDSALHQLTDHHEFSPTQQIRIDQTTLKLLNELHNHNTSTANQLLLTREQAKQTITIFNTFATNPEALTSQATLILFKEADPEIQAILTTHTNWSVDNNFSPEQTILSDTETIKAALKTIEQRDTGNARQHDYKRRRIL